MKLTVRVAVNKHDESWRHAYVVVGDDLARARVVAFHLDDLDSASVLLRNSEQVGLELPARGAAVCVELDEHGTPVVEDFALEGGVVCLVDHARYFGTRRPMCPLRSI